MAASKRKTQRPSRALKSVAKKDPEPLLQLLIVLTGCDAPVWRRILVPARYNFWELHVAIQDVMGWLDYHLHEFVVTDPETMGALRIGLPDDEFLDAPLTLPGWKIPIEGYFGTGQSLPSRYTYDFGDNWEHVVHHEDFQVAEPGITYPVCLAGENACPPEDVGGTHGYREFLKVIADPRDPEHEHFRRWAGGDFDPRRFDPAAVRFDDPAKRFRLAFGRAG